MSEAQDIPSLYKDTRVIRKTVSLRSVFSLTCLSVLALSRMPLPQRSRLASF